MSSRGPFPLTSCVRLVIKTQALSSKNGTAGHRGNSNSGGGKAQALKNVLDLMPQKVFTEIVVRAVSEMGCEKSPWSDDAFSNKRIYPGATPVGRSSSVAWRTRLKVTNESMCIMWKCLVDRHKKHSQTCSPGKLSKSTMEHDADQAALVHSVVREVQAIVPIH